MLAQRLEGALGPEGVTAGGDHELRRVRGQRLPHRAQLRERLPGRGDREDVVALPRLDDQRARGDQPLPAMLDYAAVPGLSTEMIERLSAAMPESLLAAGRVRGVTPAALTAILLHAKRMDGRRAA